MDQKPRSSGLLLLDVTLCRLCVPYLRPKDIVDIVACFIHSCLFCRPPGGIKVKRVTNRREKGCAAPGDK